MSTFNVPDSSAVTYNRYARLGERPTHRSYHDADVSASERDAAVDSAEVSEEARALGEAKAAEELGRAERREGIRALMEKLAADCADLDSHIKAVLKKSGLDVTAVNMNFIFNMKGEIDYGKGSGEVDAMRTRVQDVLNNGVDDGDAESVRKLKAYGKYAYSDKVVLIDSRDSW